MATAKYTTNLARAKADGYRILTKMIPNRGYHFINPKITGFNVRKPPILVYEHTDAGWQLAALEWVFTSMPATAPLPGAPGTACSVRPATMTTAPWSSPTPSPNAPPRRRGRARSSTSLHPRLITLHFWVWYPNYTGIYAGTDPMVAPLNHN